MIALGIDLLDKTFFFYARMARLTGGDEMCRDMETTNGMNYARDVSLL